MASKTTFYCDFCGAETSFINLTRFQGEIWHDVKHGPRAGTGRKTLVDCTAESYELCPNCKDAAIAQLAPFIDFMYSKGGTDVFDGEDEGKEQASDAAEKPVNDDVA